LCKSYEVKCGELAVEMRKLQVEKTHGRKISPLDLSEHDSYLFDRLKRENLSGQISPHDYSTEKCHDRKLSAPLDPILSREEFA
jgi:hypothetical protein